jgi:hypothetical protein
MPRARRSFDVKPTSQAESLTALELFERPQLAVRRANRLLREQPASSFRVMAASPSLVV